VEQPLIICKMHNKIKKKGGSICLWYIFKCIKICGFGQRIFRIFCMAYAKGNKQSISCSNLH